MKSQQRLIDEGIFIEGNTASPHSIAKFYSDQLIKFNNLGIGKETENGVRVTERLIKITEKRLSHLRPFIRLVKEGKQYGTV